MGIIELLVGSYAHLHEMSANHSSVQSSAWHNASMVVIIAYLVGLWLLYRVAITSYNISPFHPLSHLPGPKLAAASHLYEAWYDVVKGGKFTEHIAQLHEEYGPIIRISPNEVHCNDAQLIPDIYASSGNRIRDKSAHMMASLRGTPLALSTFGTIPHELHRSRRGAIAKYFTRSKMLRLEPDIAALIPTFCAKVLRQTEPFDVQQAFGCLTADIIGQYAFGEAPGFVEQEGWTPNWSDQAGGFLSSLLVLKFVTPLRWIVTVVPYLSRWMTPMLRELLVASPARVKLAMVDLDAGGEKSKNAKSSVLSSILESDLPQTEKEPGRLGGEAFSLMTGGTDTTASTLATITFHLLSNPEQLTMLRKALEDSGNNVVESLSWTALEKIPYLEAVILEGLRLSSLSSRALRTARDEVLIYRSRDGMIDYPIPKGTPIGVSPVLLHHNKGVFINPAAFYPQRWTTSDAARRREMDNYMMPFSKGSRQCLGLHLAWCELYLITAAIALEILPRLHLYRKTLQDSAVRVQVTG